MPSATSKGRTPTEASAPTMTPKYASLSDLAKLRDQMRREAELEAERTGARREQAAEQRAQQERERDVFRNAVAGVKPIDAPARAMLRSEPPPPEARQRERDEKAALAQSLSDEIDLDLILDTDDQLAYRRAGVGPMVPRQLRRGHWTVQHQLDLHGHRVDEAREALASFLSECRQREIRCVRIIHGKGLGSFRRQPILKGKVMRWLVQRAEVLAFCQARPDDGGSGALLVLLAAR